MAIDIIARGLAASLLGSDGTIALEKLPVFGEIEDTSKFKPVGNLTNPSAIVGKNALEVLELILFGAQNPTLVDPSFSVSIDNNVALAGQKIQITGTLTFDRGSITPAYGTSGFRTGLPSYYTVNDEVITSQETAQAFSIEIQPEPGKNTYVCTVSFEEGEQPVNGVDDLFDAPYPAGQLSTEFIVTGVYQLYLNNGELLPFEYFEEEDGEGYQILSASEGTGIKQSFMVSNGITVHGVKQFDVLTQSWQWIGGSAEQSLTTFDKVVDSEFTSYTHNGSNRGKRDLRIYITYN